MYLKIALAVTISLTLGCSFFYFTQEGMIFYPEVLPRDFKYSFPGSFQEITLPADGFAINALHFKTEKPKGVVLYFHGNAGNLNSWGEIAHEFTRLGYDLFIFDYRGFGKSEGKIQNEQMLHRDAAVAYHYLKERYPADKIIFYGRSVGTGIAVYLAKALKPRLLILESPFLSLRDLAKYHYPLMPVTLINVILKYPMRSDLWIPEVSCPVYLFHGTKDDIVPYSASEALLKLIKTEKKLITIPGGGHNDLSDFGLYHEQLEKILQ
ncbi:MAG: lysophospholipase [Syntrophales bacterium LBB04]|nr:lysophospholipase [Syntrophales bacterium LBB04]